MPTIQIRKAERFKSKLRLGLAGPSGSGKTMSSLKLAHGISPAGKILMIDTERGSGDLYAHMFDYDIITLLPPYKPQNYIDAIRAGIDAGYDVIIIDSLTHAWSDEGGLLDQADKKSQSGNRFTVWAELTPQHRALVNAMLGAPCHIIATVRSKQDYTMEKDEKTGRTSVKKMGMAPVQREGMEYEFTTFFDVDMGHFAKTSKDRTDMFKDEVFLIDEKIGERFNEWLGSGRENPVDKLTADKKAVLAETKRLLYPEPAKNITGYRNRIKDHTGFDLTDENVPAILEKLKTMETPVAPSAEPPQTAPIAQNPAPVATSEVKAPDITTMPESSSTVGPAERVSNPDAETEKGAAEFDRALEPKASVSYVNLFKNLLEQKHAIHKDDLVTQTLYLKEKFQIEIKNLEELTQAEAKEITEALTKVKVEVV